MERIINTKLENWRTNSKRKPLLLRGARQVGKTYSVREFGRRFANFVEVNFEEHSSIKKFFQDSLTPQKIIEQLSLYFGSQIKPGSTLLFFDELQACPEAIRSLRFFYEKMPELHLIAAGSLLEFALSEIPSYGVGRIESLFMYPMSFHEFLMAHDSPDLVRAIHEASFKNPLSDVIHLKLLELLKTYLLIGGLPEVVKSYIEGKGLLDCQKIIDGLLLTYFDDFAKYKKNPPIDRLTEVFRSIAFQAGGKFKYASISDERSSTYKIALELLIKAGLTYKICHTSAGGVPLGAQITPNLFKMAMFDVGIMQRILGLDLSKYVLMDFQNIINKGALAEIFVCCELVKGSPSHTRPDIFYWHREARGSSAEVDFVIAVDGAMIPLEVKSGSGGKMKSLHIFLDEKKIKRGIKLSEENFFISDRIIRIPLYAAELVWSKAITSVE
ncbi:MAG: ATP-binding protein [Oligoflexales bacterium]|nr:ATP-binding protein [Oligoflexales bacterium]